MKIDIKKTDATKRELRFEIPKQRVAQKFEDVYKELNKVVKVKGFRQGKVPRQIMESRHGKTAQKEVMHQLVPQVLWEGLKKENIIPVDPPEIQDISFKDGIITFLAKLDIKPDVKIKDYKGIKVERKTSQVTEEEVHRALEFLRKGQGEKQEVPLDDAFAHELGYPNLDELKKFLTRQLELDKDRQGRVNVENQIIEALLKKTKFAVPESLVQKQLNHRLSEQKRMFQSQGISEEEIKKKEEEMRKTLRDLAEKEVRIYFILDKIAELEGIKVREGENLSMKVIAFLLKEATWTQR